MLNTIRAVVKEGGIHPLEELDFPEGTEVLVTPLPSAAPTPRAGLTVRRLRQSGLIGLWQDRDEIQDSAAFARQLREQAQQRGEINYDFAG